jgi:hypothetical protein
VPTCSIEHAAYLCFMTGIRTIPTFTLSSRPSRRFFLASEANFEKRSATQGRERDPRGRQLAIQV